MGRILLVIISAMLMSMQLFAVNLNTASLKELSTLKGIGKSTAEKIIKYREGHKFSSVEELMKVKGIGQKRFEAIKNDLSI